jgi:hypothetical protein
MLVGIKVFLLFVLDERRIRIQEAQKQRDPDPQHSFRYLQGEQNECDLYLCCHVDRLTFYLHITSSLTFVSKFFFIWYRYLLFCNCGFACSSVANPRRLSWTLNLGSQIPDHTTTPEE